MLFRLVESETKAGIEGELLDQTRTDTWFQSEEEDRWWSYSPETFAQTKDAPTVDPSMLFSAAADGCGGRGMRKRFESKPLDTTY